jgi:hypothetical protein
MLLNPKILSRRKLCCTKGQSATCKLKLVSRNWGLHVVSHCSQVLTLLQNPTTILSSAIEQQIHSKVHRTDFFYPLAKRMEEFTLNSRIWK